MGGQKKAGDSGLIGNHTAWIRSVWVVDKERCGKAGVSCLQLWPLVHCALITIRLTLQIRSTHYELTPGHFWSKLNKDKNPPSPWGNGAGMKTKEYYRSPNSSFNSVQPLSRVWLCNPMDCSTPGLPVHHQLPEFTQTHVHWVGDAIQPSHPLLSPSLPAPNPSQHQGLFNESFQSPPYPVDVLPLRVYAPRNLPKKPRAGPSSVGLLSLGGCILA